MRRGLPSVPRDVLRKRDGRVPASPGRRFTTLDVATCASNAAGVTREAASIAFVLASRSFRAASPFSLDSLFPHGLTLEQLEAAAAGLQRMASSPLPCPFSPAATQRPTADDGPPSHQINEELLHLRREHNELLKVLIDMQRQIQQQQQASGQTGGVDRLPRVETGPVGVPEKARNPASEPPAGTPGGQAQPVHVPAASAAVAVAEAEPALTTSQVPASSLGRAWSMGGLFARLAFDASKRRVFGRPENDSAGVISTRSLDVMVDRLCHMRGAALKLGQMLSIQDEGLVPKHVLEAFKRVRDRTHAMPQHQLQKVLAEELGTDWRAKFKAFDDTPVAAASLGQVHRATLPSGEEVAVKVQFDGVSRSISSDVSNLRWLFSFGILPKGLYVENILRELQRELERECDYTGEAARQVAYSKCLEADPERHGGLAMIHVPAVFPEVSSKRVLTTGWVNATSVDRFFDKPEDALPPNRRNAIGETFLRLTLKELFDWRMMQTDPSFANFLCGEDGFYLIDFGAARTYDREFVEKYLLLVYGATVNDREMVVKNSLELGFLTGEECAEMLDAHVQAAYVASTPFARRGPADFSSFDMSAAMAPHVKTMLRLRLTAPPLEVYSLHRRLNGCFQLMAKLKAVVDCRRVFIDTLRSIAPTLAEETRKQLVLKY
ncbi:Protein ABC transporter 1 [Diplonema papillatum]|nr:Protein ABC transporter 1 [Diplonema papillatum]